MKAITFTPRWREELVAHSEQGILIFELTMGTLHVYFPDEERWKNQVPVWALNRWADYKDACEKWCSANRVPITITNDAYVTSENPA